MCTLSMSIFHLILNICNDCFSDFDTSWSETYGRIFFRCSSNDIATSFRKLKQPDVVK